VILSLEAIERFVHLAGIARGILQHLSPTRAARVWEKYQEGTGILLFSDELFILLAETFSCPVNKNRLFDNSRESKLKFAQSSREISKNLKISITSSGKRHLGLISLQTVMILRSSSLMPDSGLFVIFV